MAKLFFKPSGSRSFCCSRVLKGAEKEKDVVKPPENQEYVRPPGISKDFVPTEFEKTILVLSGKYKSKDSIPPRITYEALDNAKSRVRIRGANLLMVATLGLCGYYIFKGKKMASEGQTISTIYSKYTPQGAQERSK